MVIEQSAGSLTKDLAIYSPLVGNLFDIHSRIASGSFGTVYKASWKNSNRFVAIKHIVPTSKPSRSINEIRCLQILGGKSNVCSLITVLRHEDNIFVVMPYYNHNKFQTYFFKLNSVDIKKYMRSLFTALDHIHKFNVVHRDVKPSNFIYCITSKRYVLIDFGLVSASAGCENKIIIPSSKYDGVDTSNEVTFNINEPVQNILNSANSNLANTNTNTPTNKLVSGHATATTPNQNSKTPTTNQIKSLIKICLHSSNKICGQCVSRPKKTAMRAGTAGYRAPEVLMKYTHQTVAVDVWSAGVIFLSLLSTCYPFFKSSTDMGHLAQITRIIGSKSMKQAANKLNIRFVCQPDMAPTSLDVLCKALRKHICLKDNCDGCIEQSAYSLLSKCLDPNPDTRISAADALNEPYFNE